MKAQEMEVVIVYKGALAYYNIVCEKDDVYSAYLKNCDGFEKPQGTLTLVKSIRHWTGSVEDDELLFELGKAIERHQEIHILFSRQG
ncbi:MAG: hypothetical protein ACXWV3_07435 [Flavisolibacter sp.]